MLKKCFFCGSKNVVRNGLGGRKQLYKCKDCGRQFFGGHRRDKSQVISDYVDGKQTIEQLASLLYKIFGVESKDCYRFYIDIKCRKNESRTYFLDKMQEKLNDKMLRDEEMECSRK